MQNLYLVRTAAVVSLAAALLGVGWMSMQSDEIQIAPEAVAVSGNQAAPAVYFPAGFEIQPGADEGPVYEYY
jgi:hypothetical protein